MSTKAQSSLLSDKQQVTLIIRMVLDRRGRLLHGEIVDVEAGPCGRFDGWRGLSRAIREWLSHQARDDQAESAKRSS